MILSSSATAAAFNGLDSAQVYAQGIASGDPYSDSVILWTHINPPLGLKDSILVNWEVATTADFKAGSQVASGNFQTDASRDWTVKTEALGLKSGQDYYYRFKVGDVVSPTGETRTLATTTDSVHLAVFSCANYTAVPEYLAYGRAATADTSRPYDAALFLGDYLYEYGPGGYASAEDSSQVRGFSPNHELISLTDYRERYAQVNTDPGLLALRASVPMIAIWDDHETANDSWKGGAENHDPATEGAWNDRVAAALQAFYEWIPIREPSQRRGLDAGEPTTPLAKGYRSFTFGDVLSLHMLETRLLARDKQLSYPDAAAVQTRIGAILADPALMAIYAKTYSLTPPSSTTDSAGILAFAKGLASPVTTELVQSTVMAAYGDPNRAMVGSTELAWLQQQMATSQAAWQVLGQQVLMMNVAVPAELLLNPGDPTLLAKYANPLQKLASGTKFSDLSPTEQALFNEQTKIPYNLDAWDGYGADRERILQSALSLGKKLVSLSGDTHNAWAGVLTTMSPANAGSLAGLEFATSGVSSPGFEKYLPGADTFLRTAFAPLDGLDAVFETYVKDVSYADLNHRGFLDLTFTRSKIQADYQLIDSYDSMTGLPLWRSERLSATPDLQLSVVTSNLASPLPIVWKSGWQELDLQTGVIIAVDGNVIPLDPADYGVIPDSGVLLPGVSVIGSDGDDQIDAATGARIDGGVGRDLIRSAVSGTPADNILFGGQGGDTFYLGAAGDRVYGGVGSDNSTVSMPDREANTFVVDLDGLAYQGGLGAAISLQDYQVGLDHLLLLTSSGALEVPLDSSSYLQRKAELNAQGILLNAAPQLVRAASGYRVRASQPFTELVPGDLFIDFDVDTLVYHLTDSLGQALPSWLQFDPLTRQIRGTPSSGDVGQLDLRLVANDGTSSAVASILLEVQPEAVPVDGYVPGPNTLAQVNLGSSKLGYALRNGSESPIQITNSGQYASTSNPGANWVTVAAAAAGSGYQLYWKNAVSDQYARWTLNGAGALSSSSLLSAAELYAAESSINFDLNADGITGAGYTAGSSTIGAVNLGSSKLGYALRNGSESPIQITYSGQYASTSNPGANWVTVAAATAGSGYQLYWKNSVTSQYVRWNLTPSGDLVSSAYVSPAEFYSAEASLGADIDRDGVTGLPFDKGPVSINGVNLGTTPLGYALQPSSGTAVPITFFGQYASASNPGQNWLAIASAPSASGYDLFWKNSSTFQYARWALNGLGSLTSSTLLSSSQLAEAEVSTAYDLNGNGIIGLAPQLPLVG